MIISKKDGKWYAHFFDPYVKVLVGHSEKIEIIVKTKNREMLVAIVSNGEFYIPDEYFLEFGADTFAGEYRPQIVLKGDFL